MKIFLMGFAVFLALAMYGVLDLADWNPMVIVAIIVAAVFGGVVTALLDWREENPCG